MDAFHTHTGIGVPLRLVQCRHGSDHSRGLLKRVTRTGFEDGLFATWRSDPSFVLNLSPFDRGFSTGRRTRFRHRILPRARGVGAYGLRIPG